MLARLPRYPPRKPDGRQRKLTAWSVVLVFLATVGACQPLHRPFQPESKTAALEGYLEPGPRAGLIVANLSGLPELPSQRLAALVAANLRDRGIAASTGSAERSRFQLRGHAEREHDPFAAPDDAVIVTLRWTLQDPVGDVAGVASQIETITPVAWHDKDEATIVAIAARAAPRIERLLNGYGDSPIPPQPLDSVVVYRVDGAPGDGAEALVHGMRRALRMRRVPVVESITDDTYVVLGAVYLGGGKTPQQQIVQIDWTVIRPDGRRIGSVRQQNAVESGRLDGAWGAVATAAVNGGADGIVSLLEAIGISWRSAPNGG